MTGVGHYTLKDRTMTFRNWSMRHQSFRDGQVTRDKTMPPGAEMFTAVVDEEKLRFIYPEKTRLSDDEYVRER
jgi:hypothetical protein